MRLAFSEGVHPFTILGGSLVRSLFEMLANDAIVNLCANACQWLTSGSDATQQLIDEPPENAGRLRSESSDQTTFVQATGRHTVPINISQC